MTVSQVIHNSDLCSADDVITLMYRDGTQDSFYSRAQALRIHSLRGNDTVRIELRKRGSHMPHTSLVID